MVRWQVSMWLRPQRISPNVMIECNSHHNDSVHHSSSLLTCMLNTSKHTLLYLCSWHYFLGKPFFARKIYSCVNSIWHCGYWPTSCNKLINILISVIMYILVVSIFDGVLGLSLLITLSALLSMEGVKGKVYFRCRSRRCSLGVWGRYRRYIDCTFFTFFLLCCWCWFTTSRNIVFCLLDAFCV